MSKKIAVAAMAVAAFSATTAFGVDQANVQRSIELKDGSTLYVFKDGKMGMENQRGRPAPMKPGVLMETKSGEKIMMMGNELMRVERLKTEDMKR